MSPKCFTGMALSALLAATQAQAGSPAFDCSKATGTVQTMICADSALAALDVKLDGLWRQVLERSHDNPDLKTIKAIQRGWIKGRDDCWKSADVRRCVEWEYRSRIAELQATHRLVPARGPFFYACERDPANEIVATFFDTDPAIALLERGDRTVVAYRDTAASGARYRGPDVTFWIHGDAARVVWGYEATEMSCALRPRRE
jgi:uncharacterized protein